MEKEIFRQLFENQIAIMGAVGVNDHVSDATQDRLAKRRHETRELMKSSALCLHDWDQGFSMNGPTRTCKLCGKWERD